MINTILIGIFKIILTIVNIVLLPINLLIENTMPDLNTALLDISDFLYLSETYIGWLLDALCIKPITISLLISVLLFKLSFPLITYVIKLAINWYDKLKL